MHTSPYLCDRELHNTTVEIEKEALEEKKTSENHIKTTVFLTNCSRLQETLEIFLEAKVPLKSHQFPEDVSSQNLQNK